MQRPATPQPWAERIPAAIENAEADLCGDLDYVHYDAGGSGDRIITREEVALAKELWAWFHQWKHDTRQDSLEPDALRAFAEKVEAL